MTEQHGGTPQHYVATKNSRRFGEMCDACRQARVVGLGYGPPDTGKTESAKQYAQWNLLKPYLPESLITFTGRDVSLQAIYFRLCSSGGFPPGVPNGVLYASCVSLGFTHRKGGADLVCSLFVSGGGCSSAPSRHGRLSGDTPLLPSDRVVDCR